MMKYLISIFVLFIIWSVLPSTCKSKGRFVKIFRLIPTGFLIIIAFLIAGLALSGWITEYYTAKASLTPEYIHGTILFVFMILGVIGSFLIMKRNYKKIEKSNENTSGAPYTLDN
jgi:hypothetical protein